MSKTLDPKIKKIINKHSIDSGIEMLQGEEIWNSLGSFIKKTMKEANYLDDTTFKNVYVKGIGTFHSIPSRIWVVKESYLKHNNESIEQL